MPFWKGVSIYLRTKWLDLVSWNPVLSMSQSIDIKVPRFRFTKVRLWKAVNGYLHQSFNDIDRHLKVLFKVTKLKELRLESKYHCDSVTLKIFLWSQKFNVFSWHYHTLYIFLSIFSRMSEEHVCYFPQSYASWNLLHCLFPIKTLLHIHSHIRLVLTIPCGIKQHSILNLIDSESLESGVQKAGTELQKLSDMPFISHARYGISSMPSNLPAQAWKTACYIKGRNMACEGDFENWAEVMSRACDQVLHLRGWTQ